jgi:hypothetical protein
MKNIQPDKNQPSASAQRGKQRFALPAQAATGRAKQAYSG